jgi:phospholipase/carboxylesterase
LAVGGIAAALVTACGAEQSEENITMIRNKRQREQPAAEGRLLARPAQAPLDASTTGTSIGLQPLGLDTKRDGFLYVPSGYQADRPAPLALMLHGAGGNAQGGLAPFQALADAAGLILLAPDSRRQTWDVILGEYGPDVAFIERALAQTFGRYAVDPARLAVGGFSDGASYALSLGITNGDLFTHIIAFSPGFIAPAAQTGAPRIFISHGTRDEVLPIDRCSRRLVPALERADYDVLYREFEGPHTVPPEIARAALEWFIPGAG